MTVTIEPVPGREEHDNNRQTYTVDLQRALDAPRAVSLRRERPHQHRARRARGGRRGAGRARARRSSLARALRRLRADQRAILGGNAPDDLVAHAAGLERGFQSLNDYVQDVAQRLDGRLARPSYASRARSPTARWSATTPTTRCPGASRRRSRCSTRAARASCSPRSTTATRLACTPSRSSRARPARALARGAGGDPRGAGRRGPARRRHHALMRLGYLGPEGTFSEQALLASAARRRRPSTSRWPPSTTRSWPCRRATVDRALVPIENALEGAVRPRSTRSPARPATW